MKLIISKMIFSKSKLKPFQKTAHWSFPREKVCRMAQKTKNQLYIKNAKWKLCAWHVLCQIWIKWHGIVTLQSMMLSFDRFQSAMLKIDQLYVWHDLVWNYMEMIWPMLGVTRPMWSSKPILTWPMWTLLIKILVFFI